MTIPAGVVEALTAALTDGADASTALRLALAGYALAPAEACQPVGWTDEDELRDVDRSGCGYLYTCKPVTPHADERRVKLLYLEPQHNPALVTFPRVRFVSTDKGFDIFRGDELVGTIFRWKAGGVYFLNIPGHETADIPGIKGDSRAMDAARAILDKPA